MGIRNILKGFLETIHLAAEKKEKKKSCCITAANAAVFQQFSAVPLSNVAPFGSCATCFESIWRM